MQGKKGVFQIAALEPSPKWRGQGEVIKKRQFEMHPLLQKCYRQGFGKNNLSFGKFV
jgi:hypothetical protein